MAAYSLCDSMFLRHQQLSSGKQGRLEYQDNNTILKNQHSRGTMCWKLLFHNENLLFFKLYNKTLHYIQKLQYEIFHNITQQTTIPHIDINKQQTLCGFEYLLYYSWTGNTYSQETLYILCGLKLLRTKRTQKSRRKWNVCKMEQRMLVHSII